MGFSAPCFSAPACGVFKAAVVEVLRAAAKRRFSGGSLHKYKKTGSTKTTAPHPPAQKKCRHRSPAELSALPCKWIVRGVGPAHILLPLSPAATGRQFQAKQALQRVRTVKRRSRRLPQDNRNA